jgi:hypothetical protein
MWEKRSWKLRKSLHSFLITLTREAISYRPSSSSASAVVDTSVDVERDILAVRPTLALHSLQGLLWVALYPNDWDKERGLRWSFL